MAVLSRIQGGIIPIARYLNLEHGLGTSTSRIKNANVLDSFHAEFGVKNSLIVILQLEDNPNRKSAYRRYVCNHHTTISAFRPSILYLASVDTEL